MLMFACTFSRNLNGLGPHVKHILARSFRTGDIFHTYVQITVVTAVFRTSEAFQSGSRFLLNHW